MSDAKTKPDGLTLYPFQEETIEKSTFFMNNAAGQHAAYVANEMGLGKSVTSICAANILEAKKILVLCPSVMRLVWRDEIKKWATTCGHSIAVILKSSDVHLMQRACWVICSYDLSHREKALSCLTTQQWDLVIVDEAQRVKNPRAKCTKAFFKHIWKTAKYRLFLSGTPFTRCVTDLYPAMAAMLPTNPLLKNYHEFANYFCYRKMTPWGVDYYGLRPEHIEELSKLMRDNFYIRYKKEEVLKDLPPKTYQKILLPPEYSLPTPKKETNDAAALLAEEAQIINAINQGKTIPVPKSLAEARRLQGELKIPAAVEFIENFMEQGTSLVVFAWHRAVIARLCTQLDKYHPVVITGETSAEDRKAAVDMFQAGKTKLFIGNIIAAGTGITLTAASNVLFVELSWLPSDVEQAAARCHRISTKNAVTIYWMISQGLDERIAEVVIRRAKEFNKICN